jgi:pimeloyl-ACP methyl ester carboxylesterase
MIIFSHANGFPFSTYRYFLEQLAPHEVRGIERLGHGSYASSREWPLLADELIDYIQREASSPVVGLGHSLGAVATLFAARKRPALFSQLILMDPPLLSWQKRYAMAVFRSIGLGRKIPPAAKARRRRTHFPDRATARSYFQPKSLFRNFHPQCFEDYVQHGLQASPTGEGLELAFEQAIEYQYFLNTPARPGRLSLQVPTQLLYSAEQEVLGSAELKALKKKMPQAQFEAVPAGHMFPLEKPEQVAARIKALIR